MSFGTPNCHFNIVNHPEMSVLDFSHGMGFLPKNIIHTKNPMWLEVIHEENISNKLHKTKRSYNLSLAYAERHFKLNFRGEDNEVKCR